MSNSSIMCSSPEKHVKVDCASHQTTHQNSSLCKPSFTHLSISQYQKISILLLKKNIKIFGNRIYKFTIKVS